MALVLKDRVQETATANTTVSFTMLGAATGYQSFSSIGNTNTTYYAATDVSGNWEAGIGTYSTTGPTLTRTTILSSSNAGSAVTFVGTVTVFVTYPSGKSVNLDASGNVSALGTIASGTWNATTMAVAYGGTGVTTSTGSGSNVLSTSPTLVTPLLGTPTSGVATNLTGLPLSTGVTGTLPVANGGTGVTTSTGTGSVVLSTSPTLVTPLLGTPTSGTLTNCTFPTLNQNTTGSSGSCTGNAATATSATTAGTITSQANSATITAATANTASTIVLRDASGNFSAGTITAALTGNVTGNVTGSSGSCTGNAATATTASSCSGNSATATTASSCSGNSATATTASSCSGNSATASAVSMSAGRTDSTAYPILWGTTGGTSQLYSASACTITSSTGQISASILYSSGNVTAYSDERVKTNWRGYGPNFIEQLAKVKHGTYDRTDKVLTQDGVSAQSLQAVLPHSVVESEEGTLSVAYGNAALVAAIKLAERVVALEARLAALEAKG